MRALRLLLAGLGAWGLCELSFSPCYGQESESVGRFSVVAGKMGDETVMFKIDTVTGQTWRLTRAKMADPTETMFWRAIPTLVSGPDMVVYAEAEKVRQWCVDHPEGGTYPSKVKTEILTRVERDALLLKVLGVLEKFSMPTPK